MVKPKNNYRDVYLYAKEHGAAEAAQKFGLSMQRINSTLLIGNDIVNGAEDRPKLEQFTPRELMEELARRGYAGTLTYTHKVDISKL
jgi:hypothetical protein